MLTSFSTRGFGSSRGSRCEARGPGWMRARGARFNFSVLREIVGIGTEEFFWTSQAALTIPLGNLFKDNFMYSYATGSRGSPSRDNISFSADFLFLFSFKREFYMWKLQRLFFLFFFIVIIEM